MLAAITEALTDLNGNPGRAGHRRALLGARKALQCRETLADLLGVTNPSRIAFTYNCTDALNLAIKGVISKGAHIVATMLEHNSVLRVLEEARATLDVSYTLLAPEPDGTVSPNAFRSALRRETALCVCTHASNVTGAIQPVAEIGSVCRASGVPFLVDGAQAIGALPANVSDIGCALYAFPGHKALCGPQGTGGLYIEPGLRLHTLREGGTGTDSARMRQPEECPERYEAGTINLPGIAGLYAGTELAAQTITETRSRERSLTEALIPGLRRMGGITIYGPQQAEARVGTVSFNMDDLSSAELADRLDAKGIAVRGGLHCAPMAHRLLGTLERGALRVSFGRYNDMQDVDGLLRALRAIRTKG